MQPLLTQDEAAELLKLSVRTVERLRVSGTGPKFLRIRHSVRYRAAAQYKQIETSLIACLKDLREKAESYAAGTHEALTDTVDDIKSVIEQAQARRMP